MSVAEYERFATMVRADVNVQVFAHVLPEEASEGLVCCSSRTMCALCRDGAMKLHGYDDKIYHPLQMSRAEFWALWLQEYDGIELRVTRGGRTLEVSWK